MKEDAFLFNKWEAEAQSWPHHIKSVIKPGRSTCFSDRTVVFSFVPMTVSQGLHMSEHFFLCAVEGSKILLPPPILWKKSRNTAAVKSQSGHWLSVPFSWHVIFVAYWSVTLYFQLFYKYIPRSQITCTENQGRRLCAEELTSLTFPVRVFMEAEVEPSSSEKCTAFICVSFSFLFSVAY